MGRAISEETPMAIADESALSRDPDQHRPTAPRQLRSLVTQAFTPRAIEALALRITTIVLDLLDHIVPQGRMDVIQDFGEPLPVIVIA
jgi:cytochrome P450